MHRRTLVLAALLIASLGRRSDALVWPDVPERVERGLQSPDPGTRRAAALELKTLSLGRAIPLLQLAFSDTDTEVRIAAADAAIRLRWTDGTELALAWLGGASATGTPPEARLRVKACEVARSMPNVKAIPILGRSLNDADATVRSSAADALGAQGSADAVPALLARIDDPAPQARIAVIQALARLGDKRAVVPLVGKVQDATPAVRQEVARALGELGDVRASQALLLQLRDNVDLVRIDAISALGRLRAPDAVDALAPLASDRIPTMRQAAIAALGRIATPEAVKALVATLGFGDDAGGGLDRTSVREALTTAGSVAAKQLVAILQAPPSVPAATSAAWILGALASKPDAGAIVTAMRKGTLTSTAGLHALAGAGTADTLPVVLEFVTDPNPNVRSEAMRAASALLDPTKPDGRAVEPLVAALRDARLSNAERAQVAILLGRTGAARAAPTLIALVTANDMPLRIAAVDALGALGPAGADESLLKLLSESDATLRLRAAVALSSSGSEKARDELLAQLDARKEMDVASVLTALSGVLARVPNDAAVARLEKELEVAAGSTRDAVIVAIGRANVPTALAALQRAAKSEDPDDRRVVASVLSARKDGAALARTLLDDSDATVRAQAAWALATLGDGAAVTVLGTVAKGADIDAAINATAAIGRIAARAKSTQLAQSLCSLITAPHPYVRANAYAGLSLAGARCGDGSPERNALANDDNDAVRAAAALTLARGNPSPDDRHALDLCTAKDRSGAVARVCRTTPAVPATTSSVLFYVVDENASAPVPRAPFAAVFTDGTIRVGTTDRRGAVFEPVAPTGDVSLRRPSAINNETRKP